MPPAHENHLLTLEVCRRHLLDGWTKKAVAEHYGLSRFQVARMLDRARERGWVRIEVEAPAWVDVDLGDRVRDALGLRQAVVVQEQTPGTTTRAELAAATARFLEDALQADDVLGLSWSRTIAETVDRLRRVPRIPVVQLTGALPRPEEAGTVELVRRFAATSRGPAYVFHAPTILSDADALATMRRQSGVAGALDLLPTVTIAVVSVGRWAPGASTLHDALPAAERTEVEAHGVIGEVSSVLVGRDGALPRPPLVERLLCPAPEQLAAVPHVVAVVPGEGSADVVRSAVASGLLDTLVISRATAEALLAR